MNLMRPKFTSFPPGSRPAHIENYNQELFRFIGDSPTPFHAVENMGSYLSERGFIRLLEGDAWNIEKNSRYYVIRNRGSIIAFYTGDNRPWETGMAICSAHTDSPCLKVKPLPMKTTGRKSTAVVGVEVYGGALLNSWLDRGLNLAGRVTALVRYGGGREVLETFLVNFNMPLAQIPSLPIHLDREANTKRSLNAEIDLRPLVHGGGYGWNGVGSEHFIFEEFVKKQLIREHPDSVTGDILGFDLISDSGIGDILGFDLISDSGIGDILGFDLIFSDADGPFYTGFDGSMISSPRLDNLLSCHAAMNGIALARGKVPAMIFCADHEEVGSETPGGARGNFFNSVLSRLVPGTENLCRAAARSFIISWDNAHAVHPGHGELYDSSHHVYLNQGPVLKVNASMRYASECESSALFKLLCKRAGVPSQTFVMRSDMPCGSTIGPAVSSGAGIKTVDAGAPTLAMHAIREITGDRDPFMLLKVIEELFSMEEPQLLSLT
ncbi:MAG: M18 family aminopeptidase [Desulfamplus sp.]|nr:M18 family aminopeptidase [Desulfamplus sp.]